MLNVRNREYESSVNRGFREILGVRDMEAHINGRPRVKSDSYVSKHKKTKEPKKSGALKNILAAIGIIAGTFLITKNAQRIGDYTKKLFENGIKKGDSAKFLENAKTTLNNIKNKAKTTSASGFETIKKFVSSVKEKFSSSKK